MKPRGHCSRAMRLLPMIVGLLWLCAACANMGRPEGGARDELPPRFVRSTPMPGSVRVNPSKVTVVFDENVQLEDAFNKVVVSPAQKQPPQVTSNGRRVTVNFRDTLQSNATYTIDFADAIKDLNEGNILDGFAIDFSTGDSIDSLRISGMVLQAENLEPAQGMLVGVYANLADTAIHTLPLERIARTNQYGQFTIRNLKPGLYRIFALNDLNHDYHWDRSEDIAFYDMLLEPSVEAIEITDTLYASDRSDSTVTRAGVRYLPNDVLLTWFNQNYKAHYLADYKRLDRRRLDIVMGAPCDSLPHIEIVDGAGGITGNFADYSLLKASTRLDTLNYWLAPELVERADSLRLAVTYLKNDSVDSLVPTTDTLRFYFRDPDRKKKKKKEKEEAPAFRIDSLTGDTIMLPPADMEFLSISARSGASQNLEQPMIIETSLPLALLDSAGVHLSMQVDTNWVAMPVRLRPDSSDLLLRSRVDIDWTPGARYRFEIDTLAAQSIYGAHNRPYKHEFTVRQYEDYSNLFFTLPGLDSLTAVVELLNSSDKPVYKAVKPVGSDRAALRLLEPGAYYARLYIDQNNNGRWDTGNLPDSIQPEEVYYYPKKITLKKNWDVEQTWDIAELPLDQQKPYALKKNRPKLKRGERPPEEVDEETDEDNLINPFAPPGRNNANNRPGSNRGLRGSNNGAGNQRYQ